MLKYNGVSGYHHTEEAKQKMSNVHKGFHYTEETKQKMSKEVNQFSKDGSFITTYPSVIEAERNTGTNAGNISKCCNGKLKSVGGFVWKFKE